MSKRTLFTLFLAFVIVAGLVGLAPARAQKTLIFWSTETQPERAKATQAIIAKFREKTGVDVRLVLTEEGTLGSLMTANLAAGTLPDVIFHPVDYTAGWYGEKILSGEAATKVITELGKEQFNALNLASDGGEGFMAVPCDGWGQILLYRKDWFDANGLEAPTTFDKIMAAAQKLNDPANNRFGIALATDPGVPYTQQVFEHFALANGVQLTDEQGNVTLDTPQMVETLRIYAELTKLGPSGRAGFEQTRAAYFAGQAAMIVWSPFILDEMAGLRNQFMPTCAECASDPAYLAKNSGIIASFVGPSGKEPAQYGQVSMLGITTSAPAEAVDFVKFFMTDTYLDWLALAPEGKFPMRTGTQENPTQFLDGWRALKTGVDTKAAIGDFYSKEVIDIVVAGASNFARWGFNQGQGRLVAGIYRELPVPRALAGVIDGSLSPEDAAKEIQQDVSDIAAALK